MFAFGINPRLGGGVVFAITAITFAAIGLSEPAAAGLVPSEILASLLPGRQSLTHLSVVGAAFVLPAIVAGIVFGLRRIAHTLGTAWFLMIVGAGMLAGTWFAADAAALMHAFVGALRAGMA